MDVSVEVSASDCLMQDEVEHILLSGMGAKDLGRAACVSTLWRDALYDTSNLHHWYPT